MRNGRGGVKILGRRVEKKGSREVGRERDRKREIGKCDFEGGKLVASYLRAEFVKDLILPP